MRQHRIQPFTAVLLLAVFIAALPTRFTTWYTHKTRTRRDSGLTTLEWTIIGVSAALLALAAIAIFREKIQAWLGKI